MNTSIERRTRDEEFGRFKWWVEFIGVVLLIWLGLLTIIIGSIKILGWTVY